jgi:hypothetical protein
MIWDERNPGADVEDGTMLPTLDLSTSVVGPGGRCFLFPAWIMIEIQWHARVFIPVEVKVMAQDHG